MYNQELTVTHSVKVYTNAMASPDEFGTPEQLSEPINEFYGLVPFPDAINELEHIKIYHMDHPELRARRAAGQYTPLDLDLNKSGFQNVIGFHFLKIIELGVYPTGWHPDYVGPARHLPESALAMSIGCLLHELGHFYQWICNSSGDIDRLINARLDEYESGQTQASNRREWFAETVLASVRGVYSDDNPADIPPGLYSLVRCMFWLSRALKNRIVVNLNPGNTGVMFQTVVNGTYRWRFYKWVNWRQYEWDGSQWGDPKP